MRKTIRLLPARTTRQAAKCDFTFVLRTALLLLLPVACSAEPPAPVPAVISFPALPSDFTSRMISLSVEHAPMSAVIAELAKQSGHNIVAWEEPRNNQADIKFKGVVKDALDKVADAYDYTWNLNKAGTILMTKRFSRQSEYPSLNAQELNRTARDVLAILNSFNFDLEKNWDATPLVLAVYESLTPEQNAILRTGKTIRVSQLSESQKKGVEQAILSSVLGNRWNKWTAVATQTQLLAGATPASYAELTYFKANRPSVTLDNGSEPAPTVPRTVESFQYVLVNKRLEEQEVGIYAAGSMVSPVGPPKRAGGKENAKVFIPPVPLAPLPASASVPTVGKPDTSPQSLASPAHLHLGTTTVKAVLQALSAQTGLKVQTESYLEERNIVMELDNVTAQTALDTLAELNDLRWFSPDKDTVMLTRKRARLPQTLADLPACMIAALPADYRTFMGVGVAKKDLPEKVVVKPDGQEEVQSTFFFPDSLAREDRLRTRLGNLLNAQWKRLRTTLLADVDAGRQAELKAGKTLAWKPLSPVLDADIRDVIMLNTITNACAGDIALLNDGLRPYQSDPDSAELRLYNGNGFQIGSSKNRIYTGMGAAIPGLKSTAPKLPTPAELAQP